MTALDAALAGVQHLGLDTAPFIYFLERNPVYVDRVRDIFRRITQGSFTGTTSVITLTEVLTQPLRSGKTALVQQYQRLLRHSRNFALLPIDTAIAAQAAELRARYAVRTPDALQIATALQAGCSAFLTNDAGLKRVSDIAILVLDELEL